MRKRKGELQMNCFLKIKRRIIALSRGSYYLCAHIRISSTKKKQSIAENRWSNSGRLGLLQNMNSKKYSHLSILFDSWWYHLKINDLQKCRSFFFSSRRSPLLCGSRTGLDLQRIRCTFGRRGRSEDRVVKTVTNGPRHQLFRRYSGCFRCFIQQFFYFCIFQKGRKVA